MKKCLVLSFGKIRESFNGRCGSNARAGFND